MTPSPAPIIPPYCAPRSPGTLLAVVKAVDVEHAPDLQPGHGVTWCNLAVQRFCILLEAPLPPGLLANQQIDWLDSAPARLAGWKPCSMEDAIRYANLGQPAIVTYFNPKGHGHIALCVPTSNTLVPHIAQAGATCFSDKLLGFGFGSLPVKFFTHA
jgi:hypothetical protein